jgi:SOS-response transcriptional repressor LexA
MKTLGERLRYARNLRGMSQDDLFDASGVKQGTISKLERGDQSRTTFTPELAKALNVPHDWLTTGSGKEPSIGDNAPSATTLDNNVSPVEIKGRVPLISWVQAGDWSEAFDPYEVGQGEEWLPAPDGCGTNTYALRIQGESMEPEFSDGEIVFVDPDREPQNKSYVIVRMEDDNTTTFKQLILERDRAFLKPLNPSWPDPIIEINGNATVAGVVISKLTTYA